MNLIAKAKVEVTLMVNADSSWGEGCSMEQIHRQAKENVLARLRSLSVKEKFSIIGDARVTSIITEEKI